MVFVFLQVFRVGENELIIKFLANEIALKHVVENSAFEKAKKRTYEHIVNDPEHEDVGQIILIKGDFVEGESENNEQNLMGNVDFNT